MVNELPEEDMFWSEEEDEDLVGSRRCKFCGAYIEMVPHILESHRNWHKALLMENRDYPWL